MLGTKWMKRKSASVMLVATMILSGAAFPTGGHSSSSPPRPRKEKLLPFAAVSSLPPLAQSGVTYDRCIQDNSNGSSLSFNTTTGDYIFTCGDCFRVTGRGVVTVKGCTTTLKQGGSESDRRIQASIDTCTKKGSASLQQPPGATRCSITDSNIANSVCSDDLIAPQVRVISPNGAEVVDAGALFTISWEAQDNVEIVRQEVHVSTDGGGAFTPIRTDLPGHARRFDWTVPQMPNSSLLRVRVVSRDGSCNAGSDAGDSNFTLWNPHPDLAYSAEAPFFALSGGFQSTLHVSNLSSEAILIEVSTRIFQGRATPNLPALVEIQPGRARTLDVADLLTLGIPDDPGDPNLVTGTLRLRHNGLAPSAITGMIAGHGFDGETSFGVPLIDPSVRYGDASISLSSPLFYLDDDTGAYLVLKNPLNRPSWTIPRIVYGAGEPGAGAGILNLGEITLGAQQAIKIDLRQFRAELEGAKWGSVLVMAEPRSVIPHLHMMSDTDGLAFGSTFVDPGLFSGSTSFAGLLRMDHDTGLAPCIVVRNLNPAETRIVDIEFRADAGAPIPPRRIILPPGEQKMLELSPYETLSGGQSINLDARLTHNGAPLDVVAGAVSMSSPEGLALGTAFRTPGPADGRRLISPFFKTDARVRGLVQISNLGSTEIQTGARVKFADSAVDPFTAGKLVIPPGATATLDLRDFFSDMPDGLIAQGSLEVFHNGAPGVVGAAFGAVGDGSDISIGWPLEGGPSFSGGMVVFPQEGSVQAGDSIDIGVVTGGGVSQPGWSVSSPSGCTGAILPRPSSATDYFEAVYTAPEDCDEEEVTIEVTTPGGVATTTVKIKKVKLKRIDTFDAQGLPTNGRLNIEGDARPSGRTRFRIVGKKAFPDTPLEVRFRQGIHVEPADDVSIDPADPRVLRGTARPQTRFIGDVEVVVCTPQQDGCKTVSKDKTGGEEGSGAYYAFDPPSPPVSVNPAGFNRAGGILTISGSGFREFPVPGTLDRILPSVRVGPIGFRVNQVTDAQITGLVERATRDVPSCQIEGQTPCKRISLKNPGGRNQDRVRSLIPLYNLLPGPPPTPLALTINFGPTTGMFVFGILGSNLDFVKTVTFRAVPALRINDQSESNIFVVAPPNCQGAAAIELIDVDNNRTSMTGFQYNFSIPTPVGPIQGFSLREAFIVGPCNESVVIVDPSSATVIPTCLRIVRIEPKRLSLPDPRLPGLVQNVAAFTFEIELDSSGCLSPPPSREAAIRLKIANGANVNNTTITVELRRFF